MEVSASEFARMCGVSAMMVCKKIKDGSLVRDCGENGRKLDTDNPKNRAYLSRKQAAMRSKEAAREMEAGFAAKNEALQAEGAGQNLDAAEEKRKLMASPNKARLMMGMTIRQLLRTFGTVDNIEQFSKIQRDLSAADEREQKTQERRLLQVPKDFVVQRVFAYMDELMNQLLDVPESICDQVIAVSLAGGDDVRVNVMHILSDNLTKCIAGAKSHVIGELNALKGKYDKSESMESMQRDIVNEILDERQLSV